MNRIMRPGGAPIVVYDLVSEVVVHEITDYALHLSIKQRASEKVIDVSVNHIIRFANYLLVGHHARMAPRNLVESLSMLSDSLLEKFRDLDFLNVKANSRSFGFEGIARATVNARLAAIYKWIWWLRQQEIIDKRIAGPSDSALTIGEQEFSASRKFRSSGARATPGRRLIMPLLYSNVKNGGSNDSGFVATREIADMTVGKLMSRESSEYRNLRDGLIVDIAVEMGLRVGSIASLRITNFDRKYIENTSEKVYFVTPKDQKFGYTNAFGMPIWLALRVCNFIDHRDQFVKRKTFNKLSLDDSLFISERSGKPLRSRSISQLIGRILRELGGPKGASIHSFRALFCTEAIEEELEERIRRKMDTSTASISHVIAMKMGHRDPMSFFPYVSRAISRASAKERAERAERARNI